MTTYASILLQKLNSSYETFWKLFVEKQQFIIYICQAGNGDSSLSDNLFPNFSTLRRIWAIGMAGLLALKTYQSMYNDLKPCKFLCLLF